MNSPRLWQTVCPSADEVVGDKITFDAFVCRFYLPHVRARKRSWEIDERIARKYLSPAFGARLFGSIKRVEIENWLQNIRKSGLSPSSCNRYLAVFKAICSLAERHGIFEHGQSPAPGVSWLKIHRQPERYLSCQEARALMDALAEDKNVSALALRLLLLTGARKNEVLKASWRHINFEHGLLVVPISKSGKPRHIILSDAALAVIRLIPREGSQWLFPGRGKDRPMSDIYLYWNRLRQRLGLPDVRIHDLRHTFASFLVNAGHSLYEVQQILGHGDPRTTMRYAHISRESLLAAAETVSGILAGNQEIAARGKAMRGNGFLHSENIAAQNGDWKI